MIFSNRYRAEQVVPLAHPHSASYCYCSLARDLLLSHGNLISAVGISPALAGRGLFMKKQLWLSVALICAAALVGYGQGSAPDDAVHTPEKGSAERQAILDALRGS